MYLIYNLCTINCYSYIPFKNFCSHLKILLFDAIKIKLDDIIQFNIKDIKEICKLNNLDLIISFDKNDNIDDFVNIVEMIEVFDLKTYKKYKDNFKWVVLNVKYSIFKKIDLSNNILIEDPGEIEYLDKKENIGIETDNINDIWFTSKGIKLFSFSFKNNIINNEWSLKIDNIDIFNLKCINHLKNKKKKILITGITGQDGSILGEYILSKNDPEIIVIGTIKSISVIKHDNLKNIIKNEQFCPLILDLLDNNKTEYIFRYIKPNYFFNCAAHTTVYNSSIQNTENTFLVNTIAPLQHLEFINKYNKDCRYLSCGSSEEFGITEYVPQDLNHPYSPINIYGITKNSTHNIIKFYRNSHNLHCSHLVMYNHESERRGLDFVTRKITNKIADIKLKFDKNTDFTPLEIGNIFSTRDWSYANDFVEAFWEIINKEKPDDYLLASGSSHTVKELIDIGFNYVNLSLDWNITENTIDSCAFHKKLLMVKINKKYYRENDEKRNFLGDTKLTFEKLNWRNKTKFKDIIEKMIENDLNILKKQETQHVSI